MRAISETRKYLGMGVAIMVNGRNPEMIIIGGQIKPGLEFHRTGNLARASSQVSRPESGFSAAAETVDDERKPSLLGVISLVFYSRFAIPKVA